MSTTRSDKGQVPASLDVSSIRTASKIKEKHFQREINDLQDKQHNILATNEQLEKENENYRYQMDYFKDEIDELVERIAMLQRELRARSKECDLLRRDQNETLEEVKVLRSQITERDQIISSNGFLLLNNSPSVVNMNMLSLNSCNSQLQSQNGLNQLNMNLNGLEVFMNGLSLESNQMIISNGQENGTAPFSSCSGSLDADSETSSGKEGTPLPNTGTQANGSDNVTLSGVEPLLINRLTAKILCSVPGEGIGDKIEYLWRAQERCCQLEQELAEEKQRAQKWSEITSLVTDEAGRNKLTRPGAVLGIQQDADRTINEYKKKLKKAEQDTERAQERIRSLELQVEDLRHEVERLDRSEKEARKEKRRIEAEHKECNERIQEAERENEYLHKRIEKLKKITKIGHPNEPQIQSPLSPSQPPNGQ